MKQITPLCLLFTSSILIASSSVSAQITQDGTLPTEVDPVGNQFVITGGSNPDEGSNLFHSFAEFSVPTNGAAIFQNASNIANIISRVTGGSLSSIDGLIQANNANLILINPNGIIFGPNAQLDIGGSFLGTTGSSLRFADGTEFMAAAGPPMLTVSVPVGVQFGANAAGIQVQGANLAVEPGRTLALVGGDLTVAGSRLSAPGGRIELGSVASGLVNLNEVPQGWTLDYADNAEFGTIQIGQALVDASGLGGGDIQVQGGRLVVQEGAQIRSFTLGSQPGGTVALRASESVELIGRGFAEFQQNFIAAALSGTINPAAEGTGVLVGTAGTGASSDIVFETPSLNLREGAVIFSPTFGEGRGGNVTIQSESVELNGSGILSGTSATGPSGRISIDTARLGVRDKSVIIGAALGNGTGGDVEINAADAVEVTSFDTATIPQGIFLATGIYTNTSGGTGEGGNLTINVEKGDLTVRNGVIASNTGALLPNEIVPIGGPGGDLMVKARNVELSGIIAERFNSGIGTTTFSNSPAGDLTISTETLLVQEGADISTATLNSGAGGTLTINASDSVELIGSRVNGLEFGGLVATSGRPNFPELDVSGDSGDLSVVTDKLIVRDGASVDVQSLGSGNAGTLSVEAGSILVDNGSSINASTQSGQGGNIRLKAEDIRWRRGSDTTATAMGTGDGGNIFIEANTIVALEDSDVTANAFEGRGGNILIDTEGLFLCADCDVIASSEVGVDGVVEITTPETETNIEFLDVPETVINPEQEVALACASNGTQTASRLAITGRGGLPPRPGEPLSSEALVSFDLPEDMAAVAPEPNPEALAPPAQGLAVNSQGEVVLTAQAPTAAPQAGLIPPDCQTP